MAYQTYRLGPRRAVMSREHLSAAPDPFGSGRLNWLIAKAGAGVQPTAPSHGGVGHSSAGAPCVSVCLRVTPAPASPRARVVRRWAGLAHHRDTASLGGALQPEGEGHHAALSVDTRLPGGLRWRGGCSFLSSRPPAGSWHQWPLRAGQTQGDAHCRMGGTLELRSKGRTCIRVRPPLAGGCHRLRL